MADRKATLTAVLVDAVSGPAKHIKAEITGIGTEAGKVTQILRGIGQGIGQQLEAGITEGIRAFTDILPALIGRGHDYLELLHSVQLETGMTAEQTSTLVGALRALGVPIDDITTLMARLGANIGKNEGLFRQLGVATRDSNGNLLNAYVIFQNIRAAVSAHGESLLSTAAAQELFGRSGFKLIEALQASDPQWKAATENVRRWGGIVDEATLKNADRLHDTIASFTQGITDIGVNIAAAIDPYLRAFVDSFARFVQAHLNEIVNFAVGVVNVVTGFISGLFGITDSLSVSTAAVSDTTKKAGNSADNFGKILKSAATGSDAFTESLNGQIKAIDAHIHALELASQRRQAIRQREQLAQSLAAAQAQLADLRGNAPFTAGLSNAEQQLALQKHAQDVINAEKDVADKRKAIGDFEADQKDRAERELLNRQKDRLQELLAAHKKADAATLQSGLQMGAGLDKGIGTVLGNLGIKTQQFAATAKSAFQGGIDAARGFLDIILGKESGPHIPGHPVERTGGLIGALGSIGSVMESLKGVIIVSVGLIAAKVAVDLAGAFAGILGGVGSLALALGPTGALFAAVGGLLVLLNQIGATPPPGAAFGTGWFGQPGLFPPGTAPKHASGGVFDTLAPTRIGNGIMGEANGETIAILANPRAAGAAGRGPAIINHFHFDFLSMPSRDQLRRLATELDEIFGVRADNVPVGMPGFRGANG